MSEETIATDVAESPTTEENTEFSRETEAQDVYVRPEDADEFVATKWNQNEEPADGEEAVEDEDALEGDEDAEEALNVLEPDGQLVKIKVDGKEAQLPLEEIVKRAQKATAADKRMQEAADVRKQATGLINALQKNPFSILSRPEFGIGEEKLREFAESYVYEKVQYENMDDDERAQYEKMREYDKLKEEEKQRETDKKSNEQKAYQDHYSTKIQEALETNNLPKNPNTVKRIAMYLSKGLEKGVRLDPNDVVPFVKKDLIEEARSLTGDDETLMELLGEEGIKKVRQKSLAKLGRKGISKPAKQGEPVRRKVSSKKLSLSEWRARNRAIMNGE